MMDGPLRLESRTGHPAHVELDYRVRLASGERVPSALLSRNRARLHFESEVLAIVGRDRKFDVESTFGDRHLEHVRHHVETFVVEAENLAVHLFPLRIGLLAPAEIVVVVQGVIVRDIDRLKEADAGKVLAYSCHVGGDVVGESREKFPIQRNWRPRPARPAATRARAASPDARKFVMLLATHVEPAFEKATDHIDTLKLMRRKADAIGTERDQGVDVVWWL